MNNRHELYHVQSADIQIAVETVGHGRPLIWAHGLSGCRQSGLAKFEHLSDHYRVIVFDQRGHADSTPVTDASLYDPDLMAYDIAAVLDALGYARAIVGGESMGAATSLRFALMWPQRTIALLQLSPAFGDSRNSEVETIRSNARIIVDEGMEAFLSQSAANQREMGMPEEVIAHLQEVRSSHTPESLATALDSVIDWRLFGDIGELGNLRIPVCIGAWPDDPLHPLELARRMAAVLPRSRFEAIRSADEFFLNPSSLGDLFHRFLQSTVD